MNFKRDMQTIVRSTFLGSIGSGICNPVFSEYDYSLSIYHEHYHAYRMEFFVQNMLTGIAHGAIVGFCVGCAEAFCEELNDCFKQAPEQNLQYK